MIVTATRELQFDAGHRVLGHKGKCRFLHGHRYRALITCQAQNLNDLGMVVDFSVVKERVGKWLEDNWDHNLLLNITDPVIKFCSMHLGKEVYYGDEFWGGEKGPYIMPEGNPTAENMAKVLFHQATQLLADNRLTVVRVRLYETPNSFADVTGSK